MENFSSEDYEHIPVFRIGVAVCVLKREFHVVATLFLEQSVEVFSAVRIYAACVEVCYLPSWVFLSANPAIRVVEVDVRPSRDSFHVVYAHAVLPSRVAQDGVGVEPQLFVVLVSPYVQSVVYVAVGVVLG